MLSGVFCFAENFPALLPHFRGIGGTAVGIQQGQLAPCNFSGMSYFGGLGRNIFCNVSLSQGSKFLRPPAVSIAPCFRAGRIRTRLRLNSPIRGKLRASQTYFCFQAVSAFCFSAPVPFPARRRKEALSRRPPKGGALREYLSPSPFLSQYSGRS